MKLHHVSGSRSLRVRWLLEELSLPYELERHALGGASLRSPEYRALNPQGRVPTLEDEGTVLFESGAIMQYLLERYGEGRLEPAPGDPMRAAYLQWFHWGEAALMPALHVIMGNRFVLKEEDRSEKALGVARKQFAQSLRVLGDALGKADYLVGDAFSAADIMVVYGITLVKQVGEMPEEPLVVHRWQDRLVARPAFQAAFEGGVAG
ncbi:MAG: glutathione S-transferase family protein [Myxococcota bacterium]